MDIFISLLVQKRVYSSVYISVFAEYLAFELLLLYIYKHIQTFLHYYTFPLFKRDFFFSSIISPLKVK